MTDDNFLDRLRHLDPAQRAAFIDGLSIAEMEALSLELGTAEGGERSETIDLLPHQQPPAGDWRIWLLAGGRGSAKSFAGGHEFTRHVLEDAPCVPSEPGGHRGIIIAPTMGDAIESCVNGPSGIKRMAASMGHEVRMKSGAGGVHVVFDTGAEAKLTGAFTPEDVERLRAAGNRCCCWAEEFAAWRQEESWEHATLGVRLGPRPRFVVTTTPKPVPLYKSLVKRAQMAIEGEEDLEGTVVITHATTADNPHLDEHVKGSLYARYGGTRLGRQELEGELVEDVLGALWTTEMVEESYQLPDVDDARRVAQATGKGVASWGGRVRLPTIDDCRRIAIGVDPPGGATECGIVAVGIVHNCPCLPVLNHDVPRTHLLVLADGSLGGPTPEVGPSPGEWARAVQWLFDRTQADKIAVERNYGGDMVEHTLRTLPHGNVLPVKQVQATRGKKIRAEPFAAMYEQRRVHHVPLPEERLHLPALEEEMMTWTHDARWSPNRLDAAVWAAAELMPSLASSPMTFATGAKAARGLGPMAGVGSGVGSGGGGRGGVVLDPSVIAALGESEREADRAAGAVVDDEAAQAESAVLARRRRWSRVVAPPQR